MTYGTGQTIEKPIVCCGCSTQCGVLVDLDAGKVVQVRGDREHPISLGYICPKGKDAPQLAYHPDRLRDSR